MIKFSKFYFLLLSLGLICSFQSCVDTDFDEPTETSVISDENTVSIASVLEMLPSSGAIELTNEQLGEGSKYIKATVTADDASGNFYKTLVFQDATGALSILIDQNNLAAEYPEGNTVYVKLNGLYLGLDKNLPRLAAAYTDKRLQRIPDALVETTIYSGKEGEQINPIEITLSEFLSNSSKYYNKLIQLNNVQFTNDFVGGTYALSNTSTGPKSENTVIEDCDANTVILRNSGYANFADEIIPSKKGSLTAIASVFGNDKQLFIRDLDDVAFTDVRCGDSNGGGETPNTELTIASLQDAFYNQGATSAPEGYITGVVINDVNSGNFNNQNIIIQNGDRGILVRFTDVHSYELGDEVKVVVSNKKLEEYNNLLQVNEVPNANASSLGKKDLPTAKKITVKELLDNNNKYESTRVSLKDVTLSGSTFEGNNNVTDATGTVILRTSKGAVFASEQLPSGEVDLVAIVQQYKDNVQLYINSTSDIVGGSSSGGGGSEEEEVNTDFNGLTKNSPISLKGWLNVAVKGNKLWYASEYQGDGFAECEAYKADQPEIESWLITPSIDTEKNSILSFQSAKAFWKHDGLTVWISSDFTDVKDASWVQVTDVRLASESDENYTFVDSGDINLKDYASGKVRFAWKYEGTSAAKTTKIRIDNVVLK